MAGIILFGVLAGRTDLELAAKQSLADLSARGYAPITETAPVQVHPLESGGAGEAGIGGGWRPGLISVRPDPVGTTSAATILRHELMHEANHRTCGARLPAWAGEAAAIAFSGEATDGGDLVPRMVEHLREQVRIDAPLDAVGYRALSRLVAQHGWPTKPCAVSSAIGAVVSAGEPGRGLAYVVISALSGRVLESGGDQAARWPPGSLLKLPYVAALGDGDDRGIGAELLRSDTDALLKHRDRFERERYLTLLSSVAGASVPETSSEQRWRALLGERDSDGAFPVEGTLHELALLIRAAILSRPARFSALRGNGSVPGSTLEKADSEVRRAVQELNGLGKTGSTSNARGDALVGHLAITWPAARPEYVAVLRRVGSRGAAVADGAAEVIDRWRRTYTRPRHGEVRVRLFSLLSFDDVSPVEACPRMEIERDGKSWWMTTCGEIRLRAMASTPWPDRSVFGLIEGHRDRWMLATDSESYADGVLEAEASDLRGEARRALRAVAAWDGMNGRHRHPEDDALCDSTHCMVFRGVRPPLPNSGESSEPDLIGLLDALAARKRLTWLPFSKGGAQPWSKRIPNERVLEVLREPIVLDIVRERQRSGAVVFHLTYADKSETVPCDALRRAFGFPSCPAEVLHDSEGWIFRGVGEGHGLGLDVERARAQAESGMDAAAILRSAFE